MNIGLVNSQLEGCIREIHVAAANNNLGSLSKAAQKLSLLFSQLQGKPEAVQFKGEAVAKLSNIMTILEASNDVHVQDFVKLVKEGHPQAYIDGSLAKQMEGVQLEGKQVLEDQDSERGKQLTHQLSESIVAARSVTILKGKVWEVTWPHLAAYNAKELAFARAKNAIAVSQNLLPAGSIDTAVVNKLYVYTEKGPETGRKMKEEEDKEISKLEKALLLEKVGAKVDVPQDRSTWLLALALTYVAEEKDLAAKDILPRITHRDKVTQDTLDRERDALLKGLNIVESFCYKAAKDLPDVEQRKAGYKQCLEFELKKNIPRAEAILNFYKQWRHTIEC